MLIQLRHSSSSLLGPRSIIPLSVLSRNPEDAYHNALLLSKTTAAIHVFYDRPIWNTNPLPNLKDCSGRLRVSTRRPIYPRGRFRELYYLSTVSRFLPQISRHGSSPSSVRRLSLPSRRFSPLMLVPTDQPFPSCCRFLHLPH